MTDKKQPNETSKALTPIDGLKKILSADTVKEQFKNALADSAPLFVASLIDIYGTDTYLQQCQPKSVVMEALKAATLRLPINKALGFAYLVPYKNKGEYQPQFQIGYKGLLQLAIRSGQFRYINADCVYEGETVHKDRLTGEIAITGEATGDKVVGYFAFFETLNGFRKATCWTKKEVDRHAKKFSKSYGSAGSAWTTNFDAMALKTVLRALIGKYAIMSIEMVQALSSDSEDYEESVNREINENANQGPVVDVEYKEETKPDSEAPTNGGGPLTENMNPSGKPMPASPDF
jgi:recombination protein RecT